MAAVATVPLFMNNATLKIDTAGDNYESAISSVKFTPSSSVQTFTAISPGAVYTEAAPTTWTLDLEFVQDWDTADSLANYLLANKGVSKPCVFEPIDGGASVAATIILAPGAIGGAAGAFGTSTVSMGVLGDPVVT